MRRWLLTGLLCVLLAMESLLAFLVLRDLDGNKESAGAREERGIGAATSGAFPQTREVQASLITLVPSPIPTPAELTLFANSNPAAGFITTGPTPVLSRKTEDHEATNPVPVPSPSANLYPTGAATLEGSLSPPSDRPGAAGEKGVNAAIAPNEALPHSIVVHPSDAVGRVSESSRDVAPIIAFVSTGALTFPQTVGPATKFPLAVPAPITPIPAPQPTATATPVPSPTATPVPSPTATLALTPTSTTQPTATATAWPTPTNTSTPTPTNTSTPTPTVYFTPTPRPSPTLAPTPTYTPTPPKADGNLAIECIFFDGLVPRSEADEYVQLINRGSGSIDLRGWRLADLGDRRQEFIFEESYSLGAGKRVRVYTNQVHPEWGGFSFGRGGSIWHNTNPDTAGLFSPSGELISQRSYPPGC